MTTRENEITFIYTVGGYDVHYENHNMSKITLFKIVVSNANIKSVL